MNIEEILRQKDAANQLTQAGKYPEATVAYREIISEINTIPQEKITPDIITQKTLILSNLSMVLTKQGKTQESLECDKIIIKKLDKTFAKSYARMINSYFLLDKFSMARYHYDLMKQFVSPEMLAKFPEITSKMESEINKKDEFANGMKQLLMGMH